MTQTQRALARYSLWMRNVEPYFVEVLLAACSAWAAKCLFLPPPNFARYPHAFALIQSMDHNEAFWAWFAAISAILKVSGLILLMGNRTRLHHLSSITLRFVGLVTSAVFWIVLGTSLLVADPDSISGGVLFMPALTALWILIRLPMLPGEPRCQRPI
jgi:hypothetical protein